MSKATHQVEQCPGCGADVVIKTARHSGLCPSCVRAARESKKTKAPSPTPSNGWVRLGDLPVRK